MKLTLLSLAWCLVSICAAQAEPAQKVLIISEDQEERQSYSQYWNELKKSNFQIQFETPRNEKLSLYTHGERNYDHLILLPTKSKGLGPVLTAKALLSYMQARGNILLLLSANSPAPVAISSLLQEVGISLPLDKSCTVVDHFNYDRISGAAQHDVVLVPTSSLHRPFALGSAANLGTKSPLVAFPHGVAQSLDPASPLLGSILAAPRTALSLNPKEDEFDETFGAGEQLSLITAFQAINDARLTVVGAADLFKNEWLDAEAKFEASKQKVANRPLVQKLTSWTFKKIGVLSIQDVRHWTTEPSHILAMQGELSQPVEGGRKNPTVYRIKQDVVFEIDLAELTESGWTPLQLQTPDELQLEFSMLSPFYRIPLQPVEAAKSGLDAQSRNSTTFRGQFKTPDQHGIFNFLVNYKRPLFSNIEFKDRVTLRHLAHDEWPRSWQIRASWPWITGLGSVIIGWVGFIGVWMYGDWSS